jgi:hypothetical protein
VFILLNAGAIELEGTRWTMHVACVGRRGLGSNRVIDLELRKVWRKDVGSIQKIQDWFSCWTAAKMVINIRFP